LTVSRFFQEGMRDIGGVRTQVGRQLGDLARVGVRLDRPVERFLEPSGGDEFHRPRDLADVPNRLAAFDDCAGFGHF